MIPGTAAEPVAAPVHAVAVETPAEPEPAFRLSPPEPHPGGDDLEVPIPAGHHVPAGGHGDTPPHHHHGAHAHHASEAPEPDDHILFELLEDAEHEPTASAAPPSVERALKEMADFAKDRRGYGVVGDRGSHSGFLGRGGSGPANWFYVRWRGAINSVLKLLRFIDTWAYLFSVPFLLMMIFGIAVEARPLIHMGAAVVVLTNYGRFWADLIALFVRPYKDGPLQGIGFLFPPYTVYYLMTRWDHMKKILARIATSCIPILLVIVIYGFVPSVNPHAKDVQGIGEKLQAGKEELDKDIKEEIGAIGDRLNKVGTPEKRSASPPP